MTLCKFSEAQNLVFCLLMNTLRHKWASSLSHRQSKVAGYAIWCLAQCVLFTQMQTFLQPVVPPFTFSTSHSIVVPVSNCLMLFGLSCICYYCLQWCKFKSRKFFN